MIATDPQPRPLSPFAGEIDYLINLICNDSISFPDLDVAIRSLEQCIFKVSDEESAIRYLHDTDAAIKTRLNDRYCQWETVHENQFAEAVLQRAVTSEKEYLLYDRFCRLIRKELYLIEGHAYGTILFVGSGPFPISAILLHRFTGKEIHCLERNAEAAEVSRKVLDRFNLSKQVIVFEGDGSTFDVSGYQVVLNALLAKPKGKIMDNIRKSEGTGKVLCRTSAGLRTLLYEPTHNRALDGFRVADKQTAGYDETISTLLIVPRKERLPLALEWIPGLDGVTRTRLCTMMNAITAADNNNGFIQPLQPGSVYFDLLDSNLKTGLKYLLVVSKANQYLGQLVLNVPLLDTYKHRAEVSALMIDPSVRGKAVSLQVAQALLEKCEALGVEYLTLDVRAGTRVASFWEYLGFETYGRLPCYSKCDGFQHEGLFMYKDVHSLKDLLRRKFERMYA